MRIPTKLLVWSCMSAFAIWVVLDISETICFCYEQGLKGTYLVALTMLLPWPIAYVASRTAADLKDQGIYDAKRLLLIKLAYSITPSFFLLPLFVFEIVRIVNISPLDILHIKMLFINILHHLEFKN